jgi:hypothetical protein
MYYSLKCNIFACLTYWVDAQVHTVFVLDDIFPNKNCMLAMCNTPFYSFRFPLSNLFGIIRFELIVRKFQDQNDCYTKLIDLFLFDFSRFIIH